ncbi:MAG: hypothetical protein GF317_04650 [Candidatus Lokiarchaeota archaeon]|nr:hypothetical protein [Candidatus Lokiarchaeota archaeon]
MPYDWVKKEEREEIKLVMYGNEFPFIDLGSKEEFEEFAKKNFDTVEENKGAIHKIAGMCQYILIC